MNIGVDKIWFHDSEIHRVIENPKNYELGFEVMYPVDWENNKFAPRTIVFSDVLNYTISEIPFAGLPTILAVKQTGDQEDRANLLIETNAGERTLLCKSVEIRPDWKLL